jgi:hypothetical protein
MAARVLVLLGDLLVCRQRYLGAAAVPGSAAAPG